MKYLFLVDWWLPFPKSEYGGMIVLVAKDRVECASILADKYGNSHANELLENVDTAEVFALSAEQESGIVKEFYT